MRTTVTLDPDVEQLLSNGMSERAMSFRYALNEAVRIGVRGQESKRGHTFAQKTFRMGEGQEFRWDKALTVGFSWNVLLAFLRLTTRPGLFRQPLPMEKAFDLVSS